MIGININCKKVDYIGLILEGLKTVETRATDSLRTYVGQRVGLVRTGCGVATLEGYATIGEPLKIETREAWEAMRDAHQVPEGDTYEFNGLKYAYPVIDVEKVAPVAIYSRGIVARKI